MTPVHAALLEREVARILAGTDPDAARHWADLGHALGLSCVIAGCGERSRAGRMCDAHYRRHARAFRNEARLINRAARGKAA